MKEWNKNRNQ